MVSVVEIVQLYAPLAGLLVMAFWLGILSNRVVTLEREERDRKETDRNEATQRDRIVRMETKLDLMRDELDKVQRELSVIHRILANMASGAGGKVVTMDTSA